MANTQSVNNTFTTSGSLGWKERGVAQELTITHLGAKRLQGLKIDRVNDSLGSSADGVNTGIVITYSSKCQ